MAAAAYLLLPSASRSLPLQSSRPISPPVSKSLIFKVKASTSVDSSSPSKPISTTNSGSRKWKYGVNSINIHFERLENGGAGVNQPRKDILLVPTISDVSTVEQWRGVAEEMVGRDGGGINWSATIVDWPGLGYSDRPKLDYNADVMERFRAAELSSKI